MSVKPAAVLELRIAFRNGYKRVFLEVDGAEPEAIYTVKGLGPFGLEVIGRAKSYEEALSLVKEHYRRSLGELVDIRAVRGY